MRYLLEVFLVEAPARDIQLLLEILTQVARHSTGAASQVLGGGGEWGREGGRGEGGREWGGGRDVGGTEGEGKERVERVGKERKSEQERNEFPQRAG